LESEGPQIAKLGHSVEVVPPDSFCDDYNRAFVLEAFGEVIQQIGPGLHAERPGIQQDRTLA